MNRQPRRHDNRGRVGNRQPRPSVAKEIKGHNGGRNTENSHISPGMTVAIVQKHDQPTGKLTVGVVAETLTNSAVHHRGIKVRLTNGIVGRVQHIQCDKQPFPPNISVQSEETEQLPSRSTLQLHDWLPISQGQQSAFNEELIEDTATDWSCSTCTFKNSGFLIHCEMCNTSK